MLCKRELSIERKRSRALRGKGTVFGIESGLAQEICAWVSHKGERG